MISRLRTNCIREISPLVSCTAVRCAPRRKFLLFSCWEIRQKKFRIFVNESVRIRDCSMQLILTSLIIKSIYITFFARVLLSGRLSIQQQYCKKKALNFKRPCRQKHLSICRRFMSEIFIITAMPANIRDYSYVASIERLKRKKNSNDESLDWSDRCGLRKRRKTIPSSN